MDDRTDFLAQISEMGFKPIGELRTPEVRRCEQYRNYARSDKGRERRARAREKYKLSPKYIETQTRYRQSEKGKLLQANCNKRCKEKKLGLPFWAVDGEAVNLDSFERVSEGTGRVEKFMRQKMVMLAAGNGDQMMTLCHANSGDKGEDAPRLDTIEMLQFLLRAKSIAPKGTPFVGYGFDCLFFWFKPSSSDEERL
jgi:hypothetical protein